MPADYIAISRNNRVRTADLHDSIVNNNRLRAKFIGSRAQAVVRCINNKLVVAAPAGIEAAFEICACGGVGCVDFYGRLLQNPSTGGWFCGCSTGTGALLHALCALAEQSINITINRLAMIFFMVLFYYIILLYITAKI